jgi:hypothetical protein
VEPIEQRMPYFYYDLIIGRDYRDQGGMELDSPQAAVERADLLAKDLATLRPELKSQGCAVRVMDDSNKELYRTPLSPLRNWISKHGDA